MLARMWSDWNSSHSAGGNVNQYFHFGKPVQQLPTELNIHLSSDPNIPLLEIYPKEIQTCAQKDVYVSVQSSNFTPNSENLATNHQEKEYRLWQSPTVGHSSAVKRN